MNTNLIFVFILLFLVILLTMYQLKLTSLTTCLLTIILILLLFKLITQKECFNDNKQDVMKNLLGTLIEYLELQQVELEKTKEKITIPTLSQDEDEGLTEEEKKSFLYILKKILKELNNTNTNTNTN